MKTLEINQIKVLNTIALLKKIIHDALSFKDDLSLKSALKSQGGLAKLSIPERGISPCSLNTLKNASESLLERGFKELDELRINAKDAIEKELVGNKENKNTRTGLTHKVNNLEHQLSITEKSNFLLSMIISELRDELKKMALSNESREFKESEYHRINKKIQTELNYTLKEIDLKIKTES
ncbi:hypothetical protein EDB69_3736 [Vibrio crassostreae]|uniref:hypothetical protein n=1 Tax=Vibrio TaxID=662 RepID=UPI0007EE9AB1|nr:MULTISPECIES: hypothetical protein [Vibrio]OBT04970.1 hypothetical protein A9257_04305 [Vibrio cyclitrophicus]PMI48194.1 hypothetical protein BCU44_21770 [Vibrio cyclitrophicus]ROO68707.1 hypothetical protein EDB64_3459 [Vibrio crassostreae]ROP04563.1 hypothetical protein EDB63_3498 [Vibrio crassostreae]RPE90553.1 hypothetical protein EDB68_3136 [Vibrio crassostreae]